jgi:hypothetical protein
MAEVDRHFNWQHKLILGRLQILSPLFAIFPAAATFIEITAHV